ncbi:MAG: hypothetical protein QNJ32_27640 [Xenococcaceae cyanobacterium MO_167.B27]|nr:hypothetical protein [Xenococcaceae cyanobacterium MO_167.B27]
MAKIEIKIASHHTTKYFCKSSYIRNRASAPRDMSAGAATAFRSAIDTVMRSLY